MFRLTQAPNVAIAQVWADLLCEAGYAATVERRYLSSIAGELPLRRARPRNELCALERPLAPGLEQTKNQRQRLYL